MTFFGGKIIPIHQAKKQGIVAVDPNELIGMYECQGCQTVYESEKGLPEIPPVCAKCADSKDMLFLGYAVD